MLSDTEQRLIAQNFAVFEHEWRFYQWILGEAFLLENHLCYYDGRVLYICAFLPHHAEPERKQVRSIQEIIADQRFGSAAFIDIWGPSAVLDECTGQVHGFTEMARYGPFPREHVIEISSLSQRLPSKARAAANAARNRGTSAFVINVDHLGGEHIALMRQFCSEREVPPTLMSFVTAAAFALSWPDAVIIEARDIAEQLEGFAVVSCPVKERAILLQAFYATKPGSRAGDAVMHEIVRWGETQGIRYVHLGYSLSNSLRIFKEKWGGLQVEDTYSELFLKRHNDDRSSLDDGFFPWKESLLWHRIQNL